MSAPEADPRYCYFLDEDQFIETDRPGFRRRVIVGDALELWIRDAAPAEPRHAT